MNTLEYLQNRYKIDIKKRSPFSIIANRKEELPKIFKDLKFKKGVEIGVLEGDFSEILCKELPECTIYSVDPWKHYPIHRNFRPAKVYEPMYQRVKKRLSKYDNSIIIRKESIVTVDDFEDESLDFVFIDADHRFGRVAIDIEEWSKKVRKGGIIATHDFVKDRKEFVATYWIVLAWIDYKWIHPWFVLHHTWEDTAFWVKQ